MKKLLPIFITALLLVGCAAPTEREVSYRQITMDEAVAMMEEEEGYIILDVRRQDEFDSGHIPGAVLLPNEVIAEQAESVLTDKNQLILVYCRSGNRSKQASQVLADLGYTNVKEFGGILDWPYAIQIVD